MRHALPGISNTLLACSHLTINCREIDVEKEPPLVVHDVSIECQAIGPVGIRHNLCHLSVVTLHLYV
jgi:hypothetical protein